VQPLHGGSWGLWGIACQGGESWPRTGGSMGTVDVCGDGVPLHVMCLVLPCKVKTQFESSASHS
jgi:hypothetical protein